MKSFLSSAALVAVLASSSGIDAFSPAPQRGVALVTSVQPSPSTFANARSQCPTHLSASQDYDSSSNDELLNESPRQQRLRSAITAIKRKSKPITLAVLTATTLRLTGTPGFLIPPAQASAPIVLKAAMKKDDPPMVTAHKKAEELKKKKSLEEFDVFMAKCNDIEDADGKKARAAYEKQYQIDNEVAAAQKKVELEEMKRSLLDKGQDPNTEQAAERETFLFEHDIDLEKISGSPQNEIMMKNFLKRGKKGKKKTSLDESQHQMHQRYIVACQVADLKARGIDPLPYFSSKEVMDKTRVIYKMDDRVAEKVAGQYEQLMEKFGGRLTEAQEGEVPFVYQSAAALAALEASSAPGAGASASAKMEARAKRAVEKEAARKEKMEARAEYKAEKAAAKEARAAEKAAAKDEKLAGKAAAAAGALAAKEAAAAATSAASAASSLADDDVAVAVAESSLEKPDTTTAVVTQQTTTASSSKANDILAQVKTYATPRNAATVVIGGGVATYAFNYYSENSGAAQSERERQLKLILGNDEDEEDDDEDDDDDDDDAFEQFQSKKPSPPKSEPKAVTPKATPTPAAPPAVPAPKPKRKLGIFAKRNANARETDLNALVGPKAQSPEFASLLAKILTFGAPGRFPHVATPGDMPFEEFDLEEAKSLLTEARADADLADEQSAEIFASVVNCMIIDIVDLAMSTLKGKNKDDKKAVAAINVVMDFMDHAASLFDAVAKDVTIKPVTYGGSLRKKDLEEMFSVYAGSSMMNMDGSGATQDHVDTLQLVFAITDKKAEGLMQKHMMKMMMNLMKDGGKGMEGMDGMPGMEGMEEMMKAMGGAGGMPGMEGMPGMPGMDGEMSPEDLKQTLGMMKDLMDSGQVSDEELVEVRSQFKEMYGEDISDLIKKATEESGGNLSDDEGELLDMFKRILGEDLK